MFLSDCPYKHISIIFSFSHSFTLLHVQIVIMASQMCGLKAPGHVYSATLQNSSDNDVTVEVEYAGSDASHSETVNVTVPKGGSQTVEEKSVSAGGHEQRKFIQKLTVTSQDGTKNELASPFEGVTSPKQNWNFEIGQDGSLKSVSK